MTKGKQDAADSDDNAEKHHYRSYKHLAECMREGAKLTKHVRGHWIRVVKRKRQKRIEACALGAAYVGLRGKNFLKLRGKNFLKGVTASSELDIEGACHAAEFTARDFSSMLSGCIVAWNDNTNAKPVDIACALEKVQEKCEEACARNEAIDGPAEFNKAMKEILPK